MVRLASLIVLACLMAAAPARAELRATAGDRVVADASGRTFVPGGFRGGWPVGSPTSVTGTASPQLYRGRLGVRGFTSRGLARGTYAVVLLLAETRGAGPGERVFDVRAQGRTVLRGVDVARAAGRDAAYRVAFTVPVRRGTLRLGFRARRGRPLVAAVAAARMRRGTGLARTLFRDDFDGPAGAAPDRNRWTADVGGRGWGNQELQSYTARPANAALDGHGRLAITARREAFAGPDGIRREFTSARLQTYGKFEFTYGRLEARMRVPAGRGLWPAFWAVGHRTYAAAEWPEGGELDVMELLGDAPDVVYGHVHGPRPDGSAYGVGAPTTAPVPLDGGLHDYSALWAPQVVQVALDGRPYLTVTPYDLPANQAWALDQPSFLLLNLAVGGRWPGAPDRSTAFPARLLVDRVLVTR